MKRHPPTRTIMTMKRIMLKMQELLSVVVPLLAPGEHFSVCALKFRFAKILFLYSI